MFYVISDQAMRNKNLNANSKLLLQIITSLANGPYGCIASNNYFMDILNFKTPKSIRIYLAELKKEDYIEVENVIRKGERRPIRTIVPKFDMLPGIEVKVKAIHKKDNDQKNKEPYEPDWLQEVLNQL